MYDCCQVSSNILAPACVCTFTLVAMAGAAGSSSCESKRGFETKEQLERMSPKECGYEFFAMMVELKLKGFISAKTACVLSYWAKRGRLQEPGSDWALPPNRTGGHYSSHFDKVVGVDLHEDGFYNLHVPLQAK